MCYSPSMSAWRCPILSQKSNLHVITGQMVVKYCKARGRFDHLNAKTARHIENHWILGTKCCEKNKDGCILPSGDARWDISPASNKIRLPRPHVSARITEKYPGMSSYAWWLPCTKTGLKDPLEAFHAECKGCMDDVSGLFFAMSGQRLPVPVWVTTFPTITAWVLQCAWCNHLTSSMSSTGCAGLWASRMTSFRSTDLFHAPRSSCSWACKQRWTRPTQLQCEHRLLICSCLANAWYQWCISCHARTKKEPKEVPLFVFSGWQTEKHHLHPVLICVAWFAK